MISSILGPSWYVFASAMGGGRSRSVVSFVAVAFAVFAGAAAVAQPLNPVYVDDSPQAWELFQGARAQRAENTGEALRLYQELLDEYGAKLIPQRDTLSDAFVSVRQRVLDDLVGDPVLLERYRVMQSSEAQRLLDESRLDELVRTRPLTPAGLEALLRLAQEAVESARFRTATRYLEAARAHPDLEPATAAHAWYLTALSAHYLLDDDERRRARTALADLGVAGRDAAETMTRLVGSDRGPAVDRGRSSLDRTTTEGLDELVGQTIWSADLGPSTASRRSSRGFAPRRPRDLATTTASVAGSVVYVNEGHIVRALDRFTGRPLWERPYRDGPLRTDPGPDADPPRDLNLIAVEGDALVTLTGQGRASGGTRGGSVVCLNAATGDLRWATNLDRLARDRGNEDLFPHGAPIIFEGHVYVLARQVTKQKLTGTYVIALDLSDGHLMWMRHVASSGSKAQGHAFSTLVLDGADLFVATPVGAVCRLSADHGDIVWLRRFTSPVDARRRMRQPWEIAGPVIVRDRVLAISPDQRSVLVLDRRTGEEQARHDAWSRGSWSSPAYLLANDRFVYGVGAEIRAFALDDLDIPQWRLPALATSGIDEPPIEPAETTLTIAGRVQCLDDALVVPAPDGLLLLEPDTGRTVHRVAVSGYGNPLAIDAQLILAGANSLDVYMSFPRAEQTLRGRIAARPDDPDPALSLLQLGVRVERLELALEGADLALAALGRIEDEAFATKARQELFDMLLEIHRRDLEATAADRELLYATIGIVAATVPQRVEYLLAHGDGVAGDDPGRAVEILQGILGDPVLAATIRREGGVQGPAARWVTDRLAGLIDEHGVALYAPQSDFAARMLEQVDPENPDLDALLAVADEFPFSPAAVEASVLAARRFVQGGDRHAGLAALASLLRATPNGDGRARLLGEFAAMAEQGGPAFRGAAADVLRLEARRRPDQPLITESGPRAADEWATALAGSPVRLPRIGTAAGPVVEIAGRVLRPTNGHAPTDRALLLDDRRLILIESDPRTPAWTALLDSDNVSLVRHDDEVILLALDRQSNDPRLTALDPATGQVRWSTPRLDTLLDPVLGIDPDLTMVMPDGRAYDATETLADSTADIAFLARRGSGVVAFDLASGSRVWTSRRPLAQVHHLRAHPFGLVLAGIDRGTERDPMGVARVAVLDPDSGAERLRVRPRLPDGVVWMQIGPRGELICASGGGIELIDLLSGQRPWTNVSLGAGDSHRGWIAGDRVIVESQTGALFSARLDDGTVSPPFDTSLLQDQTPDDLEDVRVVDDRVLAHFPRRVVCYDLEGDIIGADIINEPRRYDWVLPSAEHIVLVSQVSQRPRAGRIGGGRPESSRVYRIYVLSPNGRVEGAIIELPPVTSLLRSTALIDDWLLLSSSGRTLALPMRDDPKPPARGGDEAG